MTGTETVQIAVDSLMAAGVKRVQAAKRTHQSLRTSELLAPVTKKVVAAVVPDQVAEIMLDAFRVATEHPQGATAISLPIDVMTAGMTSVIPAFPARAFQPPEYGSSPEESLRTAARLIESARFPVLFLGARAADAVQVEAVHALLRKFPIPVVETFQAAGAISKELVHLFYGRVGLFRNQPGDKVLARADLVITVGYDQAEYDANQWNPDNRCDILHLDFMPADIGHNYSPKLELIGSPAANLKALTQILTTVARPQDMTDAKEILNDMHSWERSPEANVNPRGGPVQPLYFIKLLQSMIDTTTTVACDVGSVYIYFSRYFYSYVPKTFLVSNAQQTLGVALPWAIGASLCQTPPCSRKVVSVSGDGGFLFSGQELATAVKEGCDITHFVWNDGKYNMVEFQEVDKYGRSAGVDLGGVDFAAYAGAFGALGLRVTSSTELEAVMERALNYKGVCVVDVEIDYSRNHELMTNVITDDIL